MSNLPSPIDPTAEEARSAILTRWGLAGTAVYVAGMCVLATRNWDDILALKPDEFANTLGGIFSPLAFMWLVLGFLQQGQELRASVNALRLQGQELQNSVEQQRELVNVTKAELAFHADRLAREDEEFERSISPKFEITNVGSAGVGGADTYRFDFHLTNFGHRVSKVRLYLDEEQHYHAEISVLDNGAHLFFGRMMRIKGEEMVLARVEYLNDRKRLAEVFFTIRALDGIITVTEQ